jgi:hypothetical protein
MAAVSYVRNTSILLKNSENEGSPKSRFRARRVILADNSNGRAPASVTRSKTSQSAEPLRIFSSRLPAVF